MTVRILIPVRSLADGKTRLAAALPPPQRHLLIEQMFRHVLATAEQVAPAYVVSRDRALLAMARRPIAEPPYEQQTSLNRALAAAAATLPGEGALLVVSADLPLLSPGDLRAMIAGLDKADVVAAPDRSGTGTNALLLARPGLIPFRFGVGSFSAHHRAAAQRNLRFLPCRRPGLAHDIDHPADLVWPGCDGAGRYLSAGLPAMRTSTSSPSA